MHTDPQTATEPATLQEGEPHPQSAQRYLPSTVARASHQEPSIVGPYQSSESDVSEYFTPPDPEVIAEAGPDPTNPILPENKSVGERGGYASRTVREDIFAAAATAKANVSAAVKETRLFKHVRKSPVVDAAIAAYRKGKAGKKKLFGSKKLRGVLAAVSAVSNGMSEAGYEAGREQAERSSPPGATPLRRGTSTPKLSPAPTPIYEKEIASAEEIRKVIKSAYAGSMGSGATKVNDSSDWRSSMSTKRSASPHSSPLFGARNR